MIYNNERFHKGWLVSFCLKQFSLFLKLFYNFILSQEDDPMGKLFAIYSLLPLVIVIIFATTFFIRFSLNLSSNIKIALSMYWKSTAWSPGAFFERRDGVDWIPVNATQN